MAFIDKLNIENQNYDISISKDGNLSDEFTSQDYEYPSLFHPTDQITTNDNHKTIFWNLTKMVMNLRFLYKKLGTADFSSVGNTVSDAYLNLYNNKAPKNHAHAVGDLPISSQLVNSDSLIPTSSLVYSLNETLKSFSGDYEIGEDITTTVNCGGIDKGTFIPSDTKINKIVKDMLYTPEPPNNKYESKLIDSWSSSSDVNNFFSRYGAWNAWDGLQLGNMIDITVNSNKTTRWVICGFDMEHNQTADDGTVYDNGKGICLIPKTYFTPNNGTSNTTYFHSFCLSPDPDTEEWITGAYSGMDMHSKINVTSASSSYHPFAIGYLKNLLGDHLVQRNVLLSDSSSWSSIDGGHTESYSWKTAYATLLSGMQLTGQSAAYISRYDDGEASYKLPLFNYEGYKTGYGYWTRGLILDRLPASSVMRLLYYNCLVKADGTITTSTSDSPYVDESFYLRQMIYIH